MKEVLQLCLYITAIHCEVRWVGLIVFQVMV